MSQGPLKGVRVVETAGLGPGPFAAMLLADMGADVIRLDRPSQAGEPAMNGLMRGRRSIAIDLKHPGAQAVLLRLIERSQVLIDCFRPGVMERLGASPGACLARNPALVYARVTGWGQEGPLAQTAGHDINYIALAGALGMIGRQGAPPTVPMNLLGDFGGGMLLAFGIVSALFEAQSSGRGQVLDVSMVDAVALLLAEHLGRGPSSPWRGRGRNLLDSGAPFYDVYETRDGRWVAVGALEPPFWAELLKGLELDLTSLPDRRDPASWPALKERLGEVFKKRTRDEWAQLFEGTDACVTPVLEPDELPLHPQHRFRGTFTTLEGEPAAAVAPRFSRTPGAIQRAPGRVGQDSISALRASGFSAAEVEGLLAAGIVADSSIGGQDRGLRRRRGRRVGKGAVQ